MPENLVSFPTASSRVSPAVARACAVFLDRWDGSDVSAGARELATRLPEHVPGPLKLIIMRALRQLDVPPFPSVEAFRDAVARFAEGRPELETIADVRRARRGTRVTLDTIAEQTALPVYMLRQLEWGDFRRWTSPDWTERVARSYARAARLDPDRVAEIVHAERHLQLADPAAHPRADSAVHELAAPHEVNDTPADAVPLHLPPTLPRDRRAAMTQRPRRRHRLRRFGLAAAAVGMFVAGLGVGGTIVRDRASRLLPSIALQQPQAPPPPAVVAPPASPIAAPPPSSPTSLIAHGAAERPTDSGIPPQEVVSTSGPVAAPPGIDGGDTPSSTRAEPLLLAASAAGAPAFSPSFSSVGSAVFYHRDEGVGTTLVKADRDEATGDLRVINIVEDDARNYHVRPSPDGSKIAFDSDRDGERGVYLANADGTDVRRISGSGFAAVPSWSPDGHMLAFVRAEPDLRTWNLWLRDMRSTEMRRVTSYKYGQPWGASWFPDGRRVAYSHEDRLTVLDLPTGTKRMFKTPRAGRLVRTPAVSPDGRHIVFQVFHDGAWLLDLHDGSMQRILADPTAEEFAWDATGHRLAFHSRRSGTWSVWIMSGPES